MASTVSCRGGSSVSATTTRIASAANRSAIPRPMPLAPPVTTATRPARSFMRQSGQRVVVDRAHAGLGVDHLYADLGGPGVGVLGQSALDGVDVAQATMASTKRSERPSMSSSSKPCRFQEAR